MGENVHIRAPDSGRIRPWSHRFRDCLAVDDDDLRSHLTSPRSYIRNSFRWDMGNLDPRDHVNIVIISPCVGCCFCRLEQLQHIGFVTMVGDPDGPVARH